MICCSGSLTPPARCRSSCAGRDPAGPEPGWLQRTSLGDEVTGREEKSCCITHPADEGKEGVRRSAPAQCSQHQQGPSPAPHSRICGAPPQAGAPHQTPAHAGSTPCTSDPAAPSMACAPASFSTQRQTWADAFSHHRQGPPLAQHPESLALTPSYILALRLCMHPGCSQRPTWLSPPESLSDGFTSQHRARVTPSLTFQPLTCHRLSS